jgi:hypothetical protein
MGKRRKMSVVYMLVTLFVMVALTAPIFWFLCRSDFSLKSFEVLAPALGALVFACFLIIKSAISSSEVQISEQGEINIIIGRDKEVVAYPPFEDSLNVNVRFHTFYMNYLFVSQYLNGILDHPPAEKDFLDTVEYVFLEKLFNEWIVPSSSGLEMEALSFDSIKKNIVGNEVLNVTQDQVDLLNAKLGFETQKFTFSKMLEGKKIFLPLGTRFTYFGDGRRRRYIFENRFYEMKITLLSAGVSNFFPLRHKFHAYLAKFAQFKVEEGNISMKRFVVFAELKVKKLADFRADFDEYKAFIFQTKENLEQQVYWAPLMKKLETDFLLQK